MKNEFLKKTGGFARKNIVMLIALLLAIITCFLIPPDRQYLGYFDFNTLACLLATLAIVCALKNVNFFYFLAERTVKIFKTARSAVLALVHITFNYPALLIGVNIGGVGTLISSLASLITFREYCSHNPGKSGKYIGIFSAFNFSFLVVLTGVMLLLEHFV